jgi:hypothetical protein
MGTVLFEKKAILIEKGLLFLFSHGDGSSGEFFSFIKTQKS